MRDPTAGGVQIGVGSREELDPTYVLGAKCFARRPESQKGFYETKFHGPDKVVFDIADHPWLGAAPLDAESAAEKAPV